MHYGCYQSKEYKFYFKNSSIFADKWIDEIMSLDWAE